MIEERSLEGDGIHSGDFGQRSFERCYNLHNALAQLLRLIRMCPRESFRASDHFVDAWVVLHRAGAERVEAQIDRVVPSREAREVTDHFHLTDFRKPFDLGANCSSTKSLFRIDSRNVQIG